MELWNGKDAWVMTKSLSKFPKRLAIDDNMLSRQLGGRDGWDINSSAMG